MGVSTRPSNKHRQQRSVIASALAVVLFLVPSHHALPAAPASLPEANTTNSIAPNIAHEVAVSTVAPGQESISLAARLTSLSTHIARDVTWQVRSRSGELLVDVTANELQSPLPPGEYIIEAQYGAVAVRETIRLGSAHSLAINFILNAGGLRVLPAVAGLAAGDLTSRTFVYALSGPDKGKLIANSEIPGELLKLPAGMFRVESRIGDGNASAVTDVRIRPGKMSAIEVRHNAGLARLNFVGAPDASVSWDIRPIDGVKFKTLNGLMHKLALKPGTYLAEAHVNGEILTAKFKIIAGEERDIILGN
jgi:hypothetical protein